MDRIRTTRLEGLSICGLCAGMYGRPRGLDPQRERGDQRCS